MSYEDLALDFDPSDYRNLSTLGSGSLSLCSEAPDTDEEIDSYFMSNDLFTNEGDEQSNLAAALSSNNLIEFQKLIEDGAPITCLVEDKNTLLHAAVNLGRKEIFDFLLSTSKIPINAQNIFGQSALVRALKQNDEYCANALLEAGSDVNLIDCIGFTPLFHSISANLINISKALIRRGADVNHQKNTDITSVYQKDRTPLHQACKKADVEHVAMLMYHGADPTKLTYLQESPLDYAIIYKQLHIQEFLIDYVQDLTMDIRVFERLLKQESTEEHFKNVLDKCCDIKFKFSGDLKQIFSENLGFFNPTKLKLFLNKHVGFAKKLFSRYYSLAEILFAYSPYYNNEIDFFKESTFIENFFILIDSPEIQNLLPFVNADSCFTNIIRKQAPMVCISTDDMVQLIFTLLSYGVNLQIGKKEIDLVYKLHGDCDLFRFLLHMDLENITSVIDITKNPILPTLFYNVKVTIGDLVNRNLQNGCLTSNLTNSSDLVSFFQLFARPEFHHCKALLDNEDISSLISRNHIPSLLELSRNISRDYLIKHYKIRNSRDYYTIVNQLPIGRDNKDILSFKKKLYL